MSKRWGILALLFFARVALGLQFQTMGSVSDDLVLAFGLDYAEIGTLIGLFMLPGLFITLPAGFIGRLFSDRLLTASGLGLMAAGGLLAAIAEGFGWLAAGRIVCGIGFTLTTLYFMKMVADWFADKEIATALGLFVMSWPLGIALGQVGHEWLADQSGWPAAFVAASAYCAIAAAAVAAFYRPPPLSDIPSTTTAKASTFPPRREIILTIFASLPWSFFNAGYVVFLSFAPLILMQGEYDALEAAAMISLASWVMIISGAIAGHVSDRSGRPGLVLYVCIAVGVASLLLVQQTEWALYVSLAFGLLGMAPAGVIMAMTGDAMRPENRSFGMGVFFSSYFLLMTPTPAIAGWIYDQTGDAHDALIFGAALFALTALCHAGFQILKRALPDNAA